MKNEDFIREIDKRIKQKMAELNGNMASVRHGFTTAFYGPELNAIDCFLKELRNLDENAREAQGLLKTKAEVIDVFAIHEAYKFSDEQEE